MNVYLCIVNGDKNITSQGRSIKEAVEKMVTRVQQERWKALTQVSFMEALEIEVGDTLAYISETEK